LLSAWNFPEGMRETVRRHHQPMGAGIFQLEASLVHLADFLVNAMALGSSGETRIPPLDAKSWIRLNFSADILDSVVSAIDTQIEAVEACFLT
jgi:HD-like signal output (HDOD) protein